MFIHWKAYMPRMHAKKCFYFKIPPRVEKTIFRAVLSPGLGIREEVYLFAIHTLVR